MGGGQNKPCRKYLRKRFLIGNKGVTAIFEENKLAAMPWKPNPSFFTLEKAGDIRTVPEDYKHA